MKIYFRILSFAGHLKERLIKFFLYAVLGVAFQAVYLMLLQPMLDILFNQKPGQVYAKPELALSFSYPKELFKYHFANRIQESGPLNALLFVCLLIVIFALLSNLFRYMERMTASRLKVDVVKNMRMKIFENVTRFHVGFFNDQ